MDAFIQSIAPDTLIDLFIGKATFSPAKFRTSAHLLSSASSVLAAEISEARFRSQRELFGDRLSLTYPNGKSEAWKLLLFWAYRKKLPSEREYREDIETLVDAWFLGHELEMPGFQDAIMLKLLDLQGEIETEILAYVCDNLRPGTELSRFFAEEAVSVIINEGLDEDGLEALREEGMDDDGIEELITRDSAVCELYNIISESIECRKAMKRFEKYGSTLFDRFKCGRNEERKWWMEFMVGNEVRPKGIQVGVHGPAVSCFKPESLAERIVRASEEADLVRSVAEDDGQVESVDEMDDGREGEANESDDSRPCCGESEIEDCGDERASCRAQKCEVQRD